MLYEQGRFDSVGLSQSVDSDEVKLFFQATQIPVPQTDLPSHSLIPMRTLLEAYWPQAEEDFVRISNHQEYGSPIRELFRDDTCTITSSLRELGELVGVTDPKNLKKVRNTLQLGETGYKCDDTKWTFTPVEAAQLMVGLIGYRVRFKLMHQANNNCE